MNSLVTGLVAEEEEGEKGTKAAISFNLNIHLFVHHLLRQRLPSVSRTQINMLSKVGSSNMTLSRGLSGIGVV